MIERLVGACRFLPALSLFLLLFALASPAARACGANCDMPGDRGGVAHHVDNAVGCEALCERNGACVGWTWVRPGVQGPQAVCWIKRQVVGTMPSNCCISGYRGDRSAAASTRQFNAGAAPQRGAPPAPGGAMQAQCECVDEKGQAYNGILGQGCGVSFSLRSYDCRR